MDIPDDLTDDATDVAGLPFMDMLYRYTRAGYSLQLVTPGQAQEVPFKPHSKAKAPPPPINRMWDLLAAYRTRVFLNQGTGRC